MVAGRIEPWGISSFADATLESLAAITEVAETVEVLLLGTGAQFEMLQPDLREALRSAGLAAEAMDTGAACRTYNVLLAEGRQVAAALIAVA